MILYVRRYAQMEGLINEQEIETKTLQEKYDKLEEELSNCKNASKDAQVEKEEWEAVKNGAQ